MSKAIHPASRVSSAVAPNSARPTASLYEASSSGAASTRRHSGTIDERQSPPPYLESQRRASWAASRSLAASEWPTWYEPDSAGARGSSRATEPSAGLISQRETGVA